MAKPARGRCSRALPCVTPGIQGAQDLLGRLDFTRVQPLRIREPALKEIARNERRPARWENRVRLLHERFSHEPTGRVPCTVQDESTGGIDENDLMTG